MNNAIWPNLTKREDPHDYPSYWYMEIIRARINGVARRMGESNVALEERVCSIIDGIAVWDEAIQEYYDRGGQPQDTWGTGYE